MSNLDKSAEVSASDKPVSGETPAVKAEPIPAKKPDGDAPKGPTVTSQSTGKH